MDHSATEFSPFDKPSPRFKPENMRIGTENARDKPEENSHDGHKQQSRPYRSLTNPGEDKVYSLKELFGMLPQDLEGKVFQILDLSDLVENKGAQNECDNNTERKYKNAKYRYVQIKKVTINADLRKSEVIQIIDISSQMMYDKANAERRLMSQINAMVSHEMRNPANSIHCQNIRQQLLNERINELIQDKKTNMRGMRNQLQKILKEYEESVQIQMSSEKILNFLINDILDFAQIRQNKFRKDT